MERMTLTPVEKELIRRAQDLSVTKRRIRQVVIVGVIALIALGWVATQASTGFVFGVAAVYIVITIIEKVLYGRFVLSYKVLVQKLANRVSELEGSVEEGAV